MSKYLISYEKVDGFQRLKIIEAENASAAVLNLLAGGIAGWDTPGIRQYKITGITKAL